MAGREMAGRGRGGDQYHMKFSGDKAAAVDAYLEYRRVVGDDDGGELFTPDQYDDYKKKILPQRVKNRLFTSWSNSAGMDCKLVGKSDFFQESFSLVPFLLQMSALTLLL